MLPKYMENQFRMSASDANLYSGATSLACVVVSTILGGMLIRKFKPSIKMLLIGMMASEIILSLGFLILTVPRCQPTELQHFGRNDEGLVLSGMCNENCGCTTTSYTPYCGSDGKTTYFSPCYAGCTQQPPPIASNKENKVYGNCSCVAADAGDFGGKITEGYCVDEGCWTQALLYIAILLVLTTVSSILTVGHTMILLRSVHPNDKCLALGTFEASISVFAFIPVPPVFGALVDSACIVWEKSCDKTGNCWFYNMGRFNYLLHGLASVFGILSTLALFGLYKFRNRVRDMYEDEDEEEKDSDYIKLDTVVGTQTKL